MENNNISKCIIIILRAENLIYLIQDLFDFIVHCLLLYCNIKKK